MEFNSKAEICEYFGIDTENLQELRKEIKIRISEVHPDRTGGQFASKKQQNDYNELESALAFIDKATTIEIPRGEWDLVLFKINELITLKDNSAGKISSEQSKELNETISLSVNAYAKKHSLLKVSSISIATLLTLLWVFPSVTEQHPILSEILSPKDIGFSLIWIIVVISASFFWLFMRNIEGRDEQLKKAYGFDSTQSDIFKLFIAWKIFIDPASRKYDHEKHLSNVSFSKDDLVQFCVNSYEFMASKYGTETSRAQPDLIKKVEEDYKDSRTSFNEESSKYKVTRLFFKRPGEIDLDLGTKLAGIIIEKLKERRLINIGEAKTFGITYVFSYSYI